jgi:hypothetical protein
LGKVLGRRALTALTALASLPAGPVLLALLFGFIALPAVMFGVSGYDMTSVEPGGWRANSAALSPLSAPVLQASIGAVLASVMVAAPIGAFVARRQAFVGAMVTIPLAWVAGIVALPVLPSYLGFPYGAVNVCVSDCRPWMVGTWGGVELLLAGDRPSGPIALMFSPMYGFLPLVALVVGVSFWAAIVRRAARQTGSNR